MLTSKHVPLSFSLWLSFTLFILFTPTHFPSSSPFPASQCLSRYLGLSQSLRPPPETSPSASPFPRAHRRNTSIMGRPKVHRNPVTWPERPPFHERHAGLMVRWNCKLYGLHPTAPVLSHGATKNKAIQWNGLFLVIPCWLYSGRLWVKKKISVFNPSQLFFCNYCCVWRWTVTFLKGGFENLCWGIWYVL